MKRLNVSEFREKCLSLLDRLPAEGIVITRRGEAIARVLPVSKNHADLIGKLAGVLEIRGDVMSTGEEWGCADQLTPAEKTCSPATDSRIPTSKLVRFA